MPDFPMANKGHKDNDFAVDGKRLYPQIFIENMHALSDL